MSLSLSERAQAFSRTDNMIPVRDGLFRSRPGATQIVVGDVTAAEEWDGRIVFVRDARCVIWDTVEHDIGPAGISLSTTGYQALTTDARREDRLYIADGVNPLWFVRYEDGGYVRRNVVNDVKDPGGVPYPLSVPQYVCTWASRLWVSNGTNRIEHSDNEKPHAFDPLFTLEFQGGERAPVKAMVGQSGFLAVATSSAIWSVTGDSQYNWQRGDPLIKVGVVGPRAFCGDGQRLYFASKTGFQSASAGEALGDDRLAPAFEVPDAAAQVMLTPDGRHLLGVIARRLFVIHLASDTIGEIAEDVSGIVRLGNRFGWYGPDGIWICNRADGFDFPLKGSPQRVKSVMETWPDVYPARELMERVYFQCAGEPDAPITYELETDTGGAFRQVPASTPAKTFAALWDGSIIRFPTLSRAHEIPLYRSGYSFRHRLYCDGLMELMNFQPRLRVPLQDDDN